MAIKRSVMRAKPTGAVFHRDSQDASPERRLLAAVMLQAWNDCAGSDLHDAFTAFCWAVNEEPMFRGICAELGVRPGFVANRFREQYAERFRAVGAVAA